MKVASRSREFMSGAAAAVPGSGGGGGDRASAMSSARLGRAQNEMNAAISFDDAAHLTYRQRKRCVLERTLHLTAAKRTKVAAGARRRTVAVVSSKYVRELAGQLRKRFDARLGAQLVLVLSLIHI